MTDEALKLQRFKEAVSADITAQADQILADAQAECDRIMESSRRAAARSSESTRERLRSEADTELTRRISAARLEAQRSVLIKRGELADGVLENVKKKLADFRESKAYKEWLAKTVKACAAKYPDRKPEVRLAPADMKYAAELGAAAVPDRTIELGGAAVSFEGLGVVIDCTFDSMLENERAAFCNNKEINRE